MIPELDARILTAALRAPSAHNAQPWRIRVRDDRYELHYDHHEYLPADPDDRDAYLCMGAFLETLAIAATRERTWADVTPVFGRDGADLHVADVTFRPGLTDEPLAVHLEDRATNRTVYRPGDLSPALVHGLTELGCTLVPTAEVARLVREASILSWRDRRFVGDLRAWIHETDGRHNGMTRGQLALKRYEWWSLHGAFRLGRLPAPLAVAFAGRDIRLLRDAPAVAVLSADSDRPADLVEAGRRLLRAWVTICGQGFGYHPISIAIDRPETRPEVAALVGAGTPVALFRIGRPSGPAQPSARVALTDVLLT
jgi:nitroreductase